MGNNNMIIVIRISGMVKVPKKVNETLFRTKLRRKYSAILLEDNAINRKLLKKIRDYVAYGKINKEMTERLIELRGQMQKGNKEKKIDAKKIVEQIDKKKLEELGLKSFFRLHSPRGGIESKKHFGVGKGVLGNNQEKINELLERML